MNEQTVRLAYYGMGTLVSFSLLLYLFWFIIFQRREFGKLKDTYKNQLETTKADLNREKTELSEALEKAKNQLDNLSKPGFQVTEDAFQQWKNSLDKTSQNYEILSKWIHQEYEKTLASVKEGCEKQKNAEVETLEARLHEAQADQKRLQSEKDEAQKTADARQKRILTLEEEKNDLFARLGKEPELQKMIENLNTTIEEKKQDIEQFEWLRLPMENWLGVLSGVDEACRTRNWYTNEFRSSLLQTLMSTSFSDPSPQEDTTVNGTADEAIMRVDEFFYARLHEDADLDVLQRVRMLYFGRFNELFRGRYEIRWPRRGEVFDESYCRLDRDNGFTEVRVAITCAIFEDGELKRRARVETVARA